MVAQYFSQREEDPEHGRFVISGERYILVRAAALSTEFYGLVRSLYRDQGEREARSVAFGVLFDLAHALGKSDAMRFRERVGPMDPMDYLAAGPMHFAFKGWARVRIGAGSEPLPNDEFFTTFEHDHSFEAEAWIERGAKAPFPVCAMSAGYSSGWCEESFGIPLVAVEVTCRARGDEQCRFVMAPPGAIAGHVERLAAQGEPIHVALGSLDMPEFFRRKRLEDDLRQARDELEARVVQRTEELKQRNEQLRRANERLAGAYRAREDFLALISHELRTPLVTGLGYVELLLAGKLGELSAAAQGGLQVALRNLQRLTGLVDDILRYQQIVLPVGPAPALLPLDLVELCAECVEGFCVRTGRKESSVCMEVPDGLPRVLGDGDMLRQVIGNLLDNAQRHAGSDVAVRVRAELVKGDMVSVAVEDDGPGVRQDLLGRITEPFVRHGRERFGLGLGLAIVDQLVRAHGSALKVQSVEGQGATFSFLLRAVTDAEEAESAPTHRRRRRSSGEVARPGVHVLVVEDDADTREFVALVLRQAGCRVTVVATAEEALVVLDRPSVDAVLVDQGLPGMSGTELCAAVREMRGEDTPLIYLFTAHADEGTRQECEMSGCDGMLIKPVAVADLRDFAKAARASSQQLL